MHHALILSIMAPSTNISTALVIIIMCCFQFIAGSYSTSLTTVNNCNYPVFTTIVPLATAGFTLRPGQSIAVDVLPTWSGRITGHSTLQFAQGSHAPPVATVAEFILKCATGGLDIFDVSVIDGYNIPIIVEPVGGNGTTENCVATGCVGDLNTLCPFEQLKVMNDDKVVVACKSACQAFGYAQFCCSGAYATPEKCSPTAYSLFFKNTCPRLRTYVYDPSSSWRFACLHANFVVTFCPSSLTSLIAPPNDEYPAKKANTGTSVDDLFHMLKDLGIFLVSLLAIISIGYKIKTLLKSRRDSRIANQVGLTVGSNSVSVNV